MWDGKDFKKVLEFSSGKTSYRPLFTDLDNDGTNELVFENVYSDYGELPQIYKWNTFSKLFDRADGQFPDYWNEKIAKEIEKLKQWQFSPNSRDPLVYCARIANYFSLRRGAEGVQVFLNLADEKLQFLIENRKNNYIQKRAGNLKKSIHQLLSMKTDEKYIIFEERLLKVSQ